MTSDKYTCVYLHYVQNRINHRLRFGIPQKVVTIDKRRKIACFTAGQILGYSRWSGNKYGTQDWRFCVVRTGQSGPLNLTEGIKPAAQSLLCVTGKAAVKRSLNAIDSIEKQLASGLESVPASYWLGVSNALMTKQALPNLPRYLRKQEGVSC
ncbi:DUF2840 domain-containing protein [Fretibacter rubidus]|uniref:DUF2840 domain-containing protein n=1 Tax=Fretibacter rubidus TaxID=570162 RepID=UPI00352A34A2